MVVALQMMSLNMNFGSSQKGWCDWCDIISKTSVFLKSDGFKTGKLTECLSYILMIVVNPKSQILHQIITWVHDKTLYLKVARMITIVILDCWFPLQLFMHSNIGFCVGQIHSLTIVILNRSLATPIFCVTLKYLLTNLVLNKLLVILIISALQYWLLC